MNKKTLKTISIVVGGLTIVGGCGIAIYKQEKCMADTCEYYEKEIKKLKYEIIEKDCINNQQKLHYLDELDRNKILINKLLNMLERRNESQ